MTPFVLAAALLLSSPDSPVAPHDTIAAGIEPSNALAAPGPGGYLAAWTVSTSERSTIQTALIGHDGSVGQAASVDGFLRAVEGTGDGWLLAIERDSAILLARIDAAGELVATRPSGLGASDVAMARGEASVLLFTGREAVLATFEGEVERRVDAGTGYAPAVAATRTGFLVVWRDGSTIYARALNHRARLRSEIVVLGSSYGQPSVATSGSQFLVTWPATNGDPATGGGGIEGRIVDAEAQPLSEVTMFVRSTTGNTPLAVWDSGGYRVYFTRDGDDWLVDVNVAGRAGTPRQDVGQTRRLRDVVRIQRVACAEGAAVVATLPGVAPFIVSLGPPLRDVPAVTATANGFATAFYERSDVARYRLRLPSGVVVTLSGHVFPSRVPPALATDGTNTLAVWRDYERCDDTILAALFAPDGTLLRKTAIDATGTNLTAAWNGSEYAMAWTDLGPFDIGIAGVRLGATGELLDRAPRRLARRDPRMPRTPTVSPRALSIVWTGSEWLLIHERAVFHPLIIPPASPDEHELHLQRLSLSLDPIEAVRVLADIGINPHAAAGLAGTLIVSWDGDGTLRARLLAHGGALVRETVLVTGGDSEVRPSVAASGASFLVAAGETVFRITADGTFTQLTTLPAGARRSVLAANRSGAHIAYVLGQEIFVRALALPAPRARAVRHP